MLSVDIPGFGDLRLRHLVLDYNGTLALDGLVLPGVAERLEILGRSLALHIITADTFGSVQGQVAHLPVKVSVIPRGREAEAKLSLVRELGETQTAAVGNGMNDRLMLRAAALGIAVCQGEGLALASCVAADVLVPDILTGLDLLVHPQRLRATLRS